MIDRGIGLPLLPPGESPFERDGREIVQPAQSADVAEGADGGRWTMRRKGGAGGGEV